MPSSVFVRIVRIVRVLLLLTTLVTMPTIVRKLPAVLVAHDGVRELHGWAFAQPCASEGVLCPGPAAGDGTASAGGGSQGTHAAQPPSPPVCDDLCRRAQRTYQDPRTQMVLLALAQTPTGRDTLTYLLFMGYKLGNGFISWQDLSASHAAGLNTDGGYIQLNSVALTNRYLGLSFLAGVLVHESVESYFDDGEGMRNIATRHMDYVAQWFAGRFERQLHTLPYYAAQDPWYDPRSNPRDESAYGLSYNGWLNETDDGRLYLDEQADCDLHHIDRKGHAWPPSDWLAEHGGLWFLGQGTDVSPVPDPLRLSLAMLSAADLSDLA